MIEVSIVDIEDRGFRNNYRICSASIQFGDSEPSDSFGYSTRYNAIGLMEIEIASTEPKQLPWKLPTAGSGGQRRTIPNTSVPITMNQARF